MGKPWTEKEIEFLKENYLKFSYKKIGVLLNRSKVSITTKATRLGLVKNGQPLSSDEVFGQLTVIDSDLENASCICNCGNKLIVKREYLKRGTAKSCGCYARNKHQKPEGDAAYNKMFATYRSNAKNKNREFSLSKEQFLNLCMQSCSLCGDDPKRFNPYLKTNGDRVKGALKTHQETIDRAWVYINGIDRIDSNKGYFLENCQTACFICNELKKDKKESIFLAHIFKITNHQKIKNGN